MGVYTFLPGSIPGSQMNGKQPIDSLGSSLVGEIIETQIIVDTNNDIR